jgi:hypothetical protein
VEHGRQIFIGELRVSALSIAIVVGILAFAAGILGLYLQKWLPERHTTDRSRDMISAVSSLVSLMLALVLGTLVSSSYNSFSTQRSELETLAATALQLDMALAQYGPEAKPARDILREALIRGYQLFWGSGDAYPKAFGVAVALPGLRAMSDYLYALDPKTPAQKELLSSAAGHNKAIESARLKMSLQLASTVAQPLLLVICSWSVLLFLGYGLLSRLSVMTIAVLAFGAFSVAGAIFLIIELRHPYSGLIRVPAAALLETIDAIKH